MRSLSSNMQAARPHFLPRRVARAAKYAHTLCIILLILAGASPASSQETDTDTPNQLWLTYEHQDMVGERTRVFGSLGYEELRSEDRFFGEWTRLNFKAGLSYDLGERFRIAAGVGAFYTFQPETDDVSEFRLWQEGTAFWPESFGHVRRFVLTHRLRLEERFTKSDERVFTMRLRYRLETMIPLNTYTLEPGTFYLPISGEVFADVADEAPEVFAQKNRVSIGLGYVINQKWTVDLRYHRQRSRANIEEAFDTSFNVIDFTVRTSIRIRDLVKNR
jgi:hypothetical protein